MVASYDFDIHWLIPREVEADPAIGKLLDDIGFNGNSRDNYIALFRDPQIVAMIDRADPVLRDVLKASGFGFTAYQSGAPTGFFPAADTTARSDVTARLEAQLRGFDFAGADLGGFDIGAFLNAVADAEPLPADDDAPNPRAAPISARPLPTPDFLPTHIGFAKLTGRNRVMPLMVLTLAITLGVYLVIQQIGAPPVP